MLWFFVIYSVLGVVLTLVSAVVTLAALARIRRRIVALQAQSRGEAVAGWDRLIDRLVTGTLCSIRLDRKKVSASYR